MGSLGLSLIKVSAVEKGIGLALFFFVIEQGKILWD